MNVSADAGARQVRPNTASAATSTAPKAQIGTTSFNPDGFQQQPAVKPAPVALTSAGEVNLADFAGKAVSFFAGSSNTSRAANPDIDVDRVKDAQYGRVDGTPFIQGSGDAHPADWNDVSQGQLGDCYFMSALGTVAQANPEVIQNAIKDNGDGSYTVTLYEKKDEGPFGIFGHHYEPREIRVTPDFPVQNGQPVFAQTGDQSGAQRELWPALMEKAFAQMEGSYHDIEGGNSGDAMAMLTGKDSSEHDADDVTIDQLDRALSGGQAVTASTFDNGKGKQPYDNGILVGDHAYMVTGVNKEAGTVTLRNPWGSHTADVVLSIADFNKFMDDVNINPTR